MAGRGKRGQISQPAINPLASHIKAATSYGMKMTLDIDARKVEEAMAAYGVATKTEVIDLALRELLRKKAVEQLMSMQGKFPNFRTNDEIEAAEKRHYARPTRR
jgi:Arc/MetJ family transcription regulator